MDFNEIKFQDAKTQTYLGSPSIVDLRMGHCSPRTTISGKAAP